MGSLFAIIMSAFWTAVAWLFRVVVIKFLVLTAIYVAVVEFSQVLMSLLPPISFGNAFAVISPGVWFFLDFFQIEAAAMMLLAAFVTRFLIRRIPVIG